jgi:hypothetical protein
MSGPTSSPIPATSLAPVGGDEYVAGTCNIGAWEIRRRRAFAITGFAIAGLMLAGLVAAGAPAPARLVLLLPLWGGCFSWLQARRRFCAAYAIGGISNFGGDHSTRAAVKDGVAHREDLRAVMRMTRDSGVIALVLTFIAVLLPL